MGSNMGYASSRVPAGNVLDRTTHGQSAEIFCFDNSQARQALLSEGYFNFDKFWNMPRLFVDDVNYRRGGWSGVSELRIGNDTDSQTYFVKRQENQQRYSWRHPFGQLTYEAEIDAIRFCQRQNLPCVDVVCWGISKGANSSRAIVVTRAIEFQSMDAIMASNPQWDLLLELLRVCGRQLYRMHSLGFRHGALYPKHIYLNPQTSEVKLIDFERSRRLHRIRSAIEPDLYQLIKRLGNMPVAAYEALLQPYLENHPNLVNSALNMVHAT